MTFSPDALVDNTFNSVLLLFGLLGWRIAEEGEKADEFSRLVTALGIQVDLSKLAEGRIFFSNAEKRVAELVHLINGFLDRGLMSTLEAQKLRGRMQFAYGQLFGRVGKLCMAAVTHQVFVLKPGRIGKSCIAALKRFRTSLQTSLPRILQTSSSDSWFIFTDACFEASGDSAVCGIGGVLINPFGIKQQFFSDRLTKQQLSLLGAGPKKTVIFEAELLALIVAMTTWMEIFVTLWSYVVWTTTQQGTWLFPDQPVVQLQIRCLTNSLMWKCAPILFSGMRVFLRPRTLLTNHHVLFVHLWKMRESRVSLYLTFSIRC